MEKKIIVCTTFREFDGSENEKIQDLFVDSIRKQNYSNYIVVVTTFGEKKVEPFLREKLKDKVVFYEQLLPDYRYSLSTVFLNGLKVALNNEGDILLWCTCDIILNDQYFSIINSLYCDDIVGTSHPNLITHSINDLQNKNLYKQDMDKGFDILFFSTKIFLSPEIQRMISQYYFYEWGVFEHFLIGIALMCSKNRINLFNYADVIKIENDREASNDTQQFLLECHRRNWETLLKCINETSMPATVKSLWRCHHKFKVKNKKIDYYCFFTKQIFSHFYKVISRKQQKIYMNIKKKILSF